MNEYYYTAHPESESRPGEFELDFEGEQFKFAYDNGVFSKGELDEGTSLLISSLPELYGRILDLGCGWGPVGVILGRKYPEAQIVMSDVNERAVQLSRQNLSKNGVSNAGVLLSDGFQNIDGTFDFIVTNPPIRAGKQVIYALFDASLARLNPRGRLYIVIRKQQGAESALKYLEKARACVIAKKKGFWIICCGGNENE